MLVVIIPYSLQSNLLYSNMKIQIAVLHCRSLHFLSKAPYSVGCRLLVSPVLSCLRSVNQGYVSLAAGTLTVEAVCCQLQDGSNDGRTSHVPFQGRHARYLRGNKYSSIIIERWWSRCPFDRALRSTVHNGNIQHVMGGWCLSSYGVPPTVHKNPIEGSIAFPLLFGEIGAILYHSVSVVRWAVD